MRINRNGFTLIELSIVLVVIGLLIGGVITFFSSLGDVKRAEITQERIEKLQESIYAFASDQGYIPCPALKNAALSSSGFGVATDCAATEAVACTSNPTDCADNGTGINEIRTGVIPTRTLGLPDEYMFDGWGNRIWYTAVKDLAVNKWDFQNFRTENNLGVIQIQDGAGNNITQPPSACDGTAVSKTCPVAAYHLFSSGENALGAINRAGTAGTCAATDEGENCDNDGIYIYKLADEHPLVAANLYDDISGWETLSMLKRNLTAEFSPLMLEPSLWLDGNDKYSMFTTDTGNTLVADTNDVGRWEDKSENKDHVTQASSSLQPIYQESYEGLAGVEFDGSGDMLDIATSTMNSRGDLAIIAVYNYGSISSSGGSGWETIAGVQNSGVTAGNLLLQRMKRTNEIGVHDSGLVDNRIGVDTASSTEMLKLRISLVNRIGGTIGGLNDMITVKSRSSSQDLSYSQAQDWGTDQSTSRIQISGKQQAVTNFMHGAIHEVLMFNRGLTENEITQIMNYLDNKWGITP